MGVAAMSVIIRINDLIDAHEDYSKCKGCKRCEEIERLRRGLDREPAEKYAHILAKGQDMTKSEILFLLNNEVNAKQIFTAMQMGGESFAMLLANYGFEKSVDGTWIENRKGIREMALTKEKLENHLAANRSVKEIAEMEGVTPAAVYSMKNYYGIEKGKPGPKKKAAEKPAEKLEAIKQEVKKAVAENPAIEQELRVLIARLKEEVGEHKINEVFLNNKVKRLEEENAFLAKELVNLKAAAEDTEQEAHEAAMTIKRLESENKGLREIVSVEKIKNSELEMEIEKTNILRKALKAVL